MILEWVGTAIGNWRWAADVPWVHLHSANPPAGVGILYILLDLIVVAVTGAMAGSEVERQTQRAAEGRQVPLMEVAERALDLAALVD